MKLSFLTSNDNCSTCGASLSAMLRYCPTCRTDAGAPNVRACKTKENLKALLSRYSDAELLANKKGLSTEFDNLKEAVKLKSGVVVTMTASTARKLFEDPNALYDNYNQLVGANARKPADPDNDRHRCSVGGLLFGSYANNIVYGALSLTEKGLPTYGDVHCRLRAITIDKRTSFLETNSYNFIADHHIAPGDNLPCGYRADWENRHMLVLAKLLDSLSSGQTEDEWQSIIIKSDSYNRDKDDFIEAHIYENFDRNAIESMVRYTNKKLSSEQELDVSIALDLYNNFRKQTI